MNDVNVRKALNYATNRQQIIDTVYNGANRLLFSDQTPNSWAYEANVTQYLYDPSKAKQLLEAAGWTVGAGGVRAKAGQSLRITLLNGQTPVPPAVLIIQQNWKDVGVDAVIETQDAVTTLDRTNKLDYLTVNATNLLGADPDDYRLWHSSQIPDPAAGRVGGGNTTGFSTPELDRLVDQARSVAGCDQGKRKELYSQIQKIIADAAPMNFLYQFRSNIAVSKRLHGVTVSPFSTNTWPNLKDLWVSG
jgi:peptide/nickel transport system substrate-binding protein